MHDPKIEKAASVYVAAIPGTHPFSRATVQRHLVEFAEEQLQELRREQRALENRETFARNFEAGLNGGGQF
jgi:hypothetical protein